MWRDQEWIVGNHFASSHGRMAYELGADRLFTSFMKHLEYTVVPSDFVCDTTYLAIPTEEWERWKELAGGIRWTKPN